MKITEKKKLAIVCMYWVLVIFLIGIEVGYTIYYSVGYRSSVNAFLDIFLLVGILPIVIIWGIVWIWSATSGKENKEIE